MKCFVDIHTGGHGISAIEERYNIDEIKRMEFIAKISCKRAIANNMFFTLNLSAVAFTLASFNSTPPASFYSKVVRG